jgi:hypothetical protein
MKPEGARVFVFHTCRQFIRKVSVLSRDEIEMDDVDMAAYNNVGEAGIRPRDEKKKVPQPLRASLSLRNKGCWNRD